MNFAIYISVLETKAFYKPSWASSTNSSARRRMTAIKQVTLPFTYTSPEPCFHINICILDILKERNGTGHAQPSQSTYRQPAQSTTDPTTGIASTGIASTGTPSATSDSKPKNSKVYFDLTVAGGKAFPGPYSLGQFLAALIP